MSMKSVSLILLLSNLAYGVTTVTLNESVSTEVQPDRMQTEISFEERSKNDQAIRHHFNTLVKTVKRYNQEGLECRGGSYRITPQYSWSNNRQKFMGYQGRLSFTCEFDAIGQFNALSSELDTTAKAFDNVKRRQGTLNWIVSDALSVKTHELLERRLIHRLQRKGEHLSDAMGKTCELESIDFHTPGRPVPVREMMMADSMAKAASVPIEQPIHSDATVTLRAKTSYGCR
ncbi:MAG: SIMPL domain-containing protein [Sulfurimonadaceae bacterium]|nr:SIMPL domain-containing protein [Sulfurimonadaceae bacterium]